AQTAKKPVQLYVVLKDLYETLLKTPEQYLKEQCCRLAVLLLLFSKDECRKSEADIEWTILAEKVSASYVLYSDNGDTSVRMKQLQTDMKALFGFYDNGSRMPVRNADAVLKNITPVIMDCIRLLHYMKGKEAKR
ncbi:MAG TPA: hypothetical protein PLT66_08955, partial [Bacillota bacterium]|nr:hypothetical protein [Bacillota bacterium]